jgi:phospholipid/cholesterol/gamma-HCH transport system ATP-binding protein
MSNPKIVLSNIYKNFSKKTVLHDVNLSINDGESVVIIGGSGSGKSVLIKLISTLLSPTSGNIIIDDVSIVGLKGKQRDNYMRRLGYCFQQNALFDSYSVWQNVVISPLMNTDISQSSAMEIAIKALESVGLSRDVINLKPSELSGGMQKRVAIARSLVLNPEIVFFDEPTSGLDPVMSVKISELIRNCQRSDGKVMTKISVMHDMKCAEIVADRIIFLYNTRIEWVGSPSEIPHANNNNLRKFVSGLME